MTNGMKLIKNFSVRGLFADFYRDSENLLKIFFFVSKHVCIKFTFAKVSWASCARMSSLENREN